MKIRNGFVSNSSSSSFIIVGFEIEQTSFDIITLVEKLFNINKEQILEKMAGNEYWKKYLEDDGQIKAFVNEILYELMNNLNFEILNGSEDGIPDDIIVIGKLLGEIDSENYSFKYKCINLKEEDKDLKDIQEKLNVDKEIQIYIGTRAC